MKISHLTLLAIIFRSANAASARNLLSDREEVHTNWDHPFSEYQSPGRDLGNEENKQLIEYSDRNVNDLSVIEDVTIMKHS